MKLLKPLYANMLKTQEEIITKIWTSRLSSLYFTSSKYELLDMYIEDAQMNLQTAYRNFFRQTRAVSPEVQE